MRHNPFNRFRPLFNEPNPDDFSDQGLSARMAAFLDGGDQSPAPVQAVVPKADDKADDKPDEKPADKPDDKPSDQGDGDGHEDEDDLPQIGQAKEVKPAAAAADSFDEAAFDAETEAEAKGMDAKAGEKFKALKAKLKNTIKENAQLKAAPAKPAPEIEQELATLRAKAAEADALRQRNEELLRVNDQVAVRESPEFIETVVKPVEEMESIIAQMAKGAGLDPSDLFAAVGETDIAKQDKMLDALQAKLGSRLVGRLERLADDYKAIQHKSAQMLANAPKHIEESRQRRLQEEQAEQQRRVAAFQAAATESFTNYAKRIPGFTDSSGKLTDLAEAALAKTASIDPTTLTPSDLGYMAFAANSLPEARREIVKLRKEIAILKGTKPAPKAMEGKPAPADHEDKSDEPQGLIERMRGKEFTFTGV